MSDEKLRKHLTNIASRFQIFECDKCAEAIKKILIEKGICGKQIKLFTGSSEEHYGNIYHEFLQQNIATNGQHQGIAVEIEGEELVFDNIEHQVISRAAWINNLYCPIKDAGGDFQLTEIDF